MELFATTGFRRSPLRFTATVVPFWYHRGENLPRLRTAGEARRAACLRLELVVESVRLRVHPACRRGPTSPTCADVARHPTLRNRRISRSPSRDRAAFGSELLIRYPKRSELSLEPPSNDLAPFLEKRGRPSHAASSRALAAVHVSGFSGDLRLALVQPTGPCDPTAVRRRDTLEPVSAIVPIHSCTPTRSFSSLDPIRECRTLVSPQCVRACEGSPGCPRERRRA